MSIQENRKKESPASAEASVQEALTEIRADQVILQVTDSKTGRIFSRTLPLEFYENANFLRLRGEDLNGRPSELVFLSDTGARRLGDLTGNGPDEDPCGAHR